jgi:GAF domain-containing protein
LDRNKAEQAEALAALRNSEMSNSDLQLAHLDEGRTARSIPAPNLAGPQGARPADWEAFRLGRDEIARLVATEPESQALFDRMMEVAKRFVDFDRANLIIFSPDHEYSRLVYVSGPAITFQTRWFRTDPTYAGWIEQPQTWMVDLEEDIGRAAPQMLDLPDVRLSLEAGTRALVALPVQEGGQIKGGLCLLSKKRGIYDAETLQILRALMLDQALLATFHAAEQAESRFILDLVRKLSQASDLRDLARTAVVDIARFYQFENTAIFKVNALRQRFELLAQELGFAGATTMPANYTQPVDQGVLGLTYSRRQAVILNDIDDGSEEARAYKAVAKEMRSELSIPIRLSGRVHWILNVEDRHASAFTDLELQALERVIEQMQSTLDRMFQRDILLDALDMWPDAVVLLDQTCAIVRSNARARLMFERDDVERADFGEFLLSPDTKIGFTAGEPAPSSTTIKGKAGKETPCLVFKFTVREEYDHVVVVLRDVTTLQWKAEFEGLKAALAETAAQVRVPVSLIASYLQQIEHRADDEKFRDLAKKALRQLGAVELTYDRVLACYDARSLPPAQRVEIDLRLALEHVLNGLPRLEREAVSLIARKPTLVSADPYRLLFALSSMTAYLLRERASTERIVVSVRNARGAVEVAMSGAVERARPLGDLSALVEATRMEIALGEDALRRMAKDCGGSFARQQKPNGREQLLLRLPSAN